MFPMVPESVVIDGTRIAYGVYGAGSPIVLVHGTPSHSVIWRHVAPELAARGYKVFVYDLLGYGASERPMDADTSVAAQARLLRALLAAWNLTSASVVAHDIGGAVALRLAIDRPNLFDRLMLVDCVSYDSWPSETWREIIDTYGRAGEGLDDATFRDLMIRQLAMTVHNPDKMSGPVLNAYLEPLCGPLRRRSFFLHQVAHYDSRYTEELTPRLKDLKPPTRLLWGENDRWQPVFWAERLSKDTGAPLEVVPQAGHFLMEDAPEAVTQAILSHIGGTKY